MALGRAHTSAEAADHEKLLLLNNRLVKHTTCCGYDLTLIPTNSLSPSIGRRVAPPDDNLNLYINHNHPDYHQNLTVSSVAHVPPS